MSKTSVTAAGFVAEYKSAFPEALCEVERRVLGSDFGSSGFTTRTQADALQIALNLGPEDRLLDIGSGRGWPGLYLAGRSGCRLTSVDLPVAGLAHARSRARREGVSAASSQVVANGRWLPFCPRSFDAIVHADVLC